MILPVKSQDEKPTASLPLAPSLITTLPNLLFTYPLDNFPTATPLPTSSTTSSTIEDGNKKAALAFKIIAPVAGVVFLIVRPTLTTLTQVFCYLWGPRGKEWGARKEHTRLIAEQQQRVLDARAASHAATFPRTARGMDRDAPAVRRQQSSTSLPAYEREAAHGEVVLGIGGVVRDAQEGEQDHRTDSAVTPTPAPEYVSLTPTAQGSSPTPTATATPSNATTTIIPSATDNAARTPCAPPTPTAPPGYCHTPASTSLPRPLSTASLTRVRIGANNPETPPVSPSTPTPTRARSGSPTPAYATNLASVPQAAPAPDPGSVVVLSAAPIPSRRARLSPLAPTPSGTFSLL
ncbi:hypothetical protein CspHIS471_0106480 [Cutaneotrichosporon sp. HIS471]|nr:hypothetical protein CspHIS471_0106480 [Cutaneotrichosporon sp. HIS471]